VEDPGTKVYHYGDICTEKLKRQKPHVSTTQIRGGTWDPNMAEKSEATFLDGFGGKIDSWN
jgi:hypothetical protein